ncbi:MAG: NHL repeat-containing protein [Planctomycetota bacterium]|jgi:sugar lactone lactonase YvrE
MLSGARVVALLALSLLTTSALAADGMQYPLGAVRNDAGELFIVDLKMHGVWKATDGKLTAYFEGSPKFRTPLNAARCIAFDKDGNVLAGDTSTREVYRFKEAGKPEGLTNAGPIKGDDGEDKGFNPGIGMPMAIAIDKDGTIFVADLELHRIFRVPHEGVPAGERAEIFATVSAPRGLAFDPDGNLIVLSTTKDQILKVDGEGNVTVLVPGRPFNFPHNIAIAADGTMFVTDGYGKCVWKIGADLKPVKLAQGGAFSNPVGLSLAGDKLIVTDPRAEGPKVFEVDMTGKVTPIELTP